MISVSSVCPSGGFPANRLFCNFEGAKLLIMIVRLQTFFLILAAAFNLTILFTPLWYASNGDFISGKTVTLEMSGMETSMETYADGEGWDKSKISFTDDVRTLMLFGLALLSSLGFLALVGLYKDRPRQMRFTYFVLIAVLVEILLVVLLSGALEDGVGGKPENDEFGQFESGPKFGLIAFGLCIIFGWFAARRIRRDERKLGKAKGEVA